MAAQHVTSTQTDQLVIILGGLQINFGNIKR
jgi:hypothetical protein